MLMSPDIPFIPREAMHTTHTDSHISLTLALTWKQFLNIAL